MDQVKLFRVIGYLEGLSFLLLLFVAMPLKYLAGHPEGVKALGMPHGILFIAYVALAYNLSIEQGWPRKRLGLALLAAFLPFGTFVFDRKYLAKSS